MMIKRSECRCICHTDAVTLGMKTGVMHFVPCCEPDDNMKVNNMTDEEIQKFNSEYMKEQKMIARDTITYKENEYGFTIPTYHCGRCGQTTEGFSICLKCNPQTYHCCKVEIMNDNKITVDPSGLTIEQTSELARMTAKSIYTQGYVAGELASQVAVYKIAYNEAIEDVLKLSNEPWHKAEILKLKKE